MSENTKKTAVFLPEGFRGGFDELTTVLDAGGRAYDIIAMTESVADADGVSVERTAAPDAEKSDAYDSLFVAGCADIAAAVRDEAALRFLAGFDSTRHLIAGCGNAPLLLLSCGLLDGRSFTGDITAEEALACGVETEDNGLPYGWLEPDGVVYDDEMLTASAAQSEELAAAFGALLGLGA